MIDEENDIHIISSYGTTYGIPGLGKGFEAQCGVKQGTPEGPFIWLAANDIVWAGWSQISTEQYHYEPRYRGAIGVPLLAFVDGGIYLSRSNRGRLYSLLGLEINGERASQHR